MISIDNINVVRDKFPLLWAQFKPEEADEDTVVEYEMGNLGKPTLSVTRDGKKIYLHSNYDPQYEAERMIENYDGKVLEYEHVFFYGIGLGLHVQEFMRKYPTMPFSLYEPCQAVFQMYLNHGSLSELPIKNLKQIYLEQQENDVERNLADLLEIVVNQKVMLVTLPCYERAFKEKYKKFAVMFKEIIGMKRVSLNVNFAFEKRWTINSLSNLPYVVQTPNILRDVDKQDFVGKPAIIVAAGPSLAEEIGNIRDIKENGLAYIFAVGSSISALLAHEIYPHAACAYDPTSLNFKVLEKVVENNISEIPLIYGSSVGYETLINYPGQKLHMITSQDTVAPYFLKTNNAESLDIVHDAPSIAVVTLELLLKLGCNPIILVGQNLAYKDGMNYPKEINNLRSAEMSNEEKLIAIEVEDVHGNLVSTSDAYNQMRQGIETFISMNPQCEVINTTRGGAKIAGASFVSLDEVIKNKLGAQAVNEEWMMVSGDYDLPLINRRVSTMHTELSDLQKLINSLWELLQELPSLAQTNKRNQLEKIFLRIDKIFERIEKNEFYIVFLYPMNRVQFELMVNQISAVRFNSDLSAKAEKVFSEMGNYLLLCRQDIDLIAPTLNKVTDKLSNLQS
ncbi:MAG: DUF115 domain-containing protein [Desulfosporosinus sp.]|nr:DUF115 domain-containing protein [Desulfosporosinus sp.]